MPSAAQGWAGAFCAALAGFRALAAGLYDGVVATSATLSAEFEADDVRAVPPQRPKAASGHAAMRQARFDAEAAPLVADAAALLARGPGRPWTAGRLTLSVPRGRAAYVGGHLRVGDWDFRLALGLDDSAAAALLAAAAAVPALAPAAAGDRDGWSVSINSLTRAIRPNSTPLQRRNGIFQQFETLRVATDDPAVAVRAGLIHQAITARLAGKPPRALLIGTIGGPRCGRGDSEAAAEAAVRMNDAASGLLDPVLRHPWRPAGVWTFHQALNARLPQADAPALS